MAQPVQPGDRRTHPMVISPHHRYRGSLETPFRDRRLHRRLVPINPPLVRIFHSCACAEPLYLPRAPLMEDGVREDGYRDRSAPVPDSTGWVLVSIWTIRKTPGVDDVRLITCD